MSIKLIKLTRNIVSHLFRTTRGYFSCFNKTISLWAGTDLRLKIILQMMNLYSSLAYHQSTSYGGQTRVNDVLWWMIWVDLGESDLIDLLVRVYQVVVMPFTSAATPPGLCAFPPGSWLVSWPSPAYYRYDARVCQPLNKKIQHYNRAHAACLENSKWGCGLTLL